MTMLAERPLKCNLYNSRIYVAASLNGNVEVAKILIENGADVNKKDKIKRSALMVMLYFSAQCRFSILLRTTLKN